LGKTPKPQIAPPKILARAASVTGRDFTRERERERESRKREQKVKYYYIIILLLVKTLRRSALSCVSQILKMLDKSVD
jgi:GTP-sensing pleiotropic transcriptional regulator CodY